MSVLEKSDVDAIGPAPRSSGSVQTGKVECVDEDLEVFKKAEGAVDFRTVGWIPAAVIFMKGR